MIARIKWWERYTAGNDGAMDNNPSPVNKRSGLTPFLLRDGAARVWQVTALPCNPCAQDCWRSKASAFTPPWPICPWRMW